MQSAIPDEPESGETGRKWCERFTSRIRLDEVMKPQDGPFDEQQFADGDEIQSGQGPVYPSGDRVGRVANSAISAKVQ